MQQAFSEREHARFLKRASMFQRRGCTPDAAEHLADRLVLRDRDGDDRRMCIECEHLQRDGACFAARNGRMGKHIKTFTPVQQILQRCEHFSWQIPS